MNTRQTGAALVIALVVAACAGGGGGAATSPSQVAPVSASPAASEPASEAPSASAPEVESPATSSDESAGAGGEETVAVADSDLGEILVDAEGMTLYAFTNDTAGESTCYDQCAQTWPPLTVEGEFEVGEGLDQTDFSTVERNDGSMQVRIGDWPLYYFANDSAPGDVNGQGVGGIWFVVGPDGELIR